MDLRVVTREWSSCPVKLVTHSHLVSRLITHGALLPLHHTSWRGGEFVVTQTSGMAVRASIGEVWGRRFSLKCHAVMMYGKWQHGSEYYVTFELDGGERSSWPTSCCVLGEGHTLLTDKEAAWAQEPVCAVWKEKRIFATSWHIVRLTTVQDDEE